MFTFPGEKRKKLKKRYKWVHHVALMVPPEQERPVWSFNYWWCSPVSSDIIVQDISIYDQVGSRCVKEGKTADSTGPPGWELDLQVTPVAQIPVLTAQFLCLTQYMPMFTASWLTLSCSTQDVDSGKSGQDCGLGCNKQVWLMSGKVLAGNSRYKWTVTAVQRKRKGLLRLASQ